MLNNTYIMKQRTVTIEDRHQKIVEKRDINFSKFVRNKIEELVIGEDLGNFSDKELEMIKVLSKDQSWKNKEEIADEMGISENYALSLISLCRKKGAYLESKERTGNKQKVHSINPEIGEYIREHEILKTLDI